MWNYHFISSLLYFYVILYGASSSEHVRFKRKDNMPRKPKATDGSKIGVLIGRNIKTARMNSGFTQSQLAEILDVENVTISRIETGAQMPSIERLEATATALGISVAALFIDPSESDSYAHLLAGAMEGLPRREKEFLCEFALTYARHVNVKKKK